MVNYGGSAMRAVPLTAGENLICWGIGAFSLVWAVILKAFLPPSLFNRLAINEREMTYEELTGTVQNVFRRSLR
jgi:hypothetical protein